MNMAVRPESPRDAEPAEQHPVLLAARGLRKEFGGFVAVNNVDLDVRHAQVHALIGPNGAGKTTVFNLLTKFLQPTAGSIRLLEQDITRTDPARVARLGLVRSFQISAVFPHLSVLDNVRVALQRPNGLATQCWLPLRSLNRLNDRAMQLLEAVGLGDRRNDLAADLSYGRKRVLELATTLALEPKVLLLDEPMAGMGHEDVHTVAEIIREVACDRAVLMVEHNLKVVADLCQQVTVLQRGEILTSGDYRSVSEDERVREAYMGTDDD
ncbi:ABC transporter ATP-binding protein [Stutzerimonas balearica]|jgi:branched-chain amino acid transport system ATP-binding protein|uniref:ABC transporter ATP-binding protein n=1 Tax=Stutzerimonas balearica TaxID=74829 RepID=A0A9X7UZ70_9GAMM|nr:ABC transporter ATP-binding protein [Stutzerimonas balearica]QQN49061.1 ABC transporter ATP-binding protein [Stutzerimonas balearica]